MKKGRCGTMTHDYKRNGTATLFAALDTLEGEVISMCEDRHRHQEWLKFLRVIDDIIPPEKQIHMIVVFEIICRRYFVIICRKHLILPALTHPEKLGLVRWGRFASHERQVN